MAEQDPHELADSLEREADKLARESEEVGGRIDETREDWHRKRADDNVPGATPPPDGASDDAGPADDA